MGISYQVLTVTNTEYKMICDGKPNSARQNASGTINFFLLFPARVKAKCDYYVLSIQSIYIRTFVFARSDSILYFQFSELANVDVASITILFLRSELCNSQRLFHIFFFSDFLHLFLLYLCFICMQVCVKTNSHFITYVFIC